MKNNTAIEIAQQALAFAKNNDHAKAIALYRQALELDVNQPSWVYAGLGNQLLRMHQVEDAELVFLAACEKHPEQTQGYVGLAMISQRCRQWDQALERWNMCLEIFPQQGQVTWRANKASALMELGRYDEAQILFQTLCENHPEEKQGWIGMAELAQRRQDWKSALRYWSDVLAKFPDHIAASIQQGNILINLEQFKEAEEVFTWARGKWPKSIEPLQMLVNLAMKAKNHSLALIRLDTLLELFPDNIHANLQRALILTKNGNYELSLKLLEKLLNPESNEPIANNNFIKILVIIQFFPNEYTKIELLNKLRCKIQQLSHVDGNEQSLLLTAKISLALRDYNNLSETVSLLNKKSVNSECLQSLSKVLEKYHSPGFPDFLSPKIFGIGLSKTATTSLNDALNILGFHSIHWENPHTKGVISQDDFFLFDSFTDISVSFQFEILYYSFPNSRFIYTTRSLESWTRSITSHYINHHGINNPKELRAQGLKKRLNGLPGWAEMILYARHDSWEEAYIYYDSRVRKFFQDKPPEKFIELSICDGEEWDNLCFFLGKDIPGCRFPTQNSSHFNF
jgi:tetratricopeptide (TPR) repeat protein